MSLHSAEYYKTYFMFLPSWPPIKNISHHLQYIEFLYSIKRQNKPILTILSLLNKTLIIEMFSVIECVVYNLLQGLWVKTKSDEDTRLFTDPYEKATTLIERAVYYELIPSELGKELKLVADARNAIHIKKQAANKPYEYAAYPDSYLREIETLFKKFLKYLWRKYSIDASGYVWPDEIV